MKKSRFTEEQIVALKLVEAGSKVGEKTFGRSRFGLWQLTL